MIVSDSLTSAQAASREVPAVEEVQVKTTRDRGLEGMGMGEEREERRARCGEEELMRAQALLKAQVQSLC